MGHISPGDKLLGEGVRKLLGAYPAPEALSSLGRRMAATCALYECPGGYRIYREEFRLPREKAIPLRPGTRRSCRDSPTYEQASKRCAMAMAPTARRRHDGLPCGFSPHQAYSTYATSTDDDPRTLDARHTPPYGTIAEKRTAAQP